MAVVEVAGRDPAWANKNPATCEATVMPRRREDHPSGKGLARAARACDARARNRNPRRAQDRVGSPGRGAAKTEN